MSSLREFSWIFFSSASQQVSYQTWLPQCDDQKGGNLLLVDTVSLRMSSTLRHSCHFKIWHLSFGTLKNQYPANRNPIVDCIGSWIKWSCRSKKSEVYIKFDWGTGLLKLFKPDDWFVCVFFFFIMIDLCVCKVVCPHHLPDCVGTLGVKNSVRSVSEYPQAANFRETIGCHRVPCFQTKRGVAWWIHSYPQTNIANWNIAILNGNIHYKCAIFNSKLFVIPREYPEFLNQLGGWKSNIPWYPSKLGWVHHWGTPVSPGTWQAHRAVTPRAEQKISGEMYRTSQ